MALIRFEQASLTRAGAPSPCLQGLNFTLDRSEVLAVLGGSGSGKTTLACWLAGWVPHSMSAAVEGMACLGDATLAGQHPVQLSEQVQLVQSRPAAGLTGCAFSVAGEVAFGPENLGWSAADIRHRVADALALCEASGLAARHPATLSGGEAQRVAIAAAVVMRPRLLLLDEAFSRLTPAAAHRLLDRLLSLTQQGVSLVLFDKRFDLAARVASQVLLLDQGRQQALGTPAEVFDQALDHVCAPDALRAAHCARRAGLWRHGVPAPLDAGAAPARFMDALRG